MPLYYLRPNASLDKCKGLQPLLRVGETVALFIIIVATLKHFSTKWTKGKRPKASLTYLACVLLLDGLFCSIATYTLL